MHDYVGSFRQRLPGVQIYAVDVEAPSGPIPPHFHEVDQFQVVVGGSGRMGRHDLGVGTVHYTDRYTSYGPILSHDRSLSFFVVRPAPGVGAHYMPDARKRRSRSGRALAESADVSLPVADDTSRVLFSTEDGVLAREVRIPPGRRLLAGDEVDRGAYIVLAGSLSRGDASLPPRTCLLVTGGLGVVQAVAGAEGCVLAHLRFRDTSPPG